MPLNVPLPNHGNLIAGMREISLLGIVALSVVGVPRSREWGSTCQRTGWFIVAWHSPPLRPPVCLDLAVGWIWCQDCNNTVNRKSTAVICPVSYKYQKACKAEPPEFVSPGFVGIRWAFSVLPASLSWVLYSGQPPSLFFCSVLSIGGRSYIMDIVVGNWLKLF